MRHIVAFLMLLFFAACAGTKQQSVTQEIFHTSVDPATEEAKTTTALISDNEEQAVDARVEITYGFAPTLYIEPCYQVPTKSVGAALDATAAISTTECVTLYGDWIAAHIWVLIKKASINSWVLCPALIMPGTDTNELIKVRRINVRTQPNSRGQDILIQTE